MTARDPLLQERATYLIGGWINLVSLPVMAFGLSVKRIIRMKQYVVKVTAQIQSANTPRRNDQKKSSGLTKVKISAENIKFSGIVARHTERDKGLD